MNRFGMTTYWLRETTTQDEVLAAIDQGIQYVERNGYGYLVRQQTAEVVSFVFGWIIMNRPALTESFRTQVIPQYEDEDNYRTALVTARTLLTE